MHVSFSSQRYLVGNTWKNFSSSSTSTESRIDGVELKTSSSKPYKLHYRTYTRGKGWLPYVTSLDNDYAGLPNMAMEALQIRVSDNNGNFLDSNYVVMYRTCNNGKWLPWVSNANPTIMNNIKSRYKLPGTLDTASGDAGLPGSGHNVTAIEIRIYEGETADSVGNGSGGYTSNTQSARILIGNTWKTLTADTHESRIDGIELKTSSSKPYKLHYRTYTRGKGWLPYVTSLENDYAGLPNMAMEALQIRVSDNNGNFLDSNYVVMYRTYNNGRWLPWVSNAKPEIMQNIKSKYNLSGTLDTAGSDAGLPGSGSNVNAIEVRIFEGETSGSTGVDFGGGSNTQSARILIGNTWKTLTADTHESRIDGIELKTSSSKPYKLHYRTYTRGKGWLPYVTSLENDYAGLPNMAMEALQIRVSDNNGNFLDSNYVVMYRTYNNGRWLPWVSNANPTIMNNIKSKYNLPGTLDTASGDAGLPGSGSNVNAIEIRVYEGEFAGSTGGSNGGSSGAESFRYLVGNTWKTLTSSTFESRIDGVEIKTSPNKPYKLHYRTYTTGKGWLPYVTSLQNDYAGLPNMAMEALQIRVSDNNGNFLDSNYVVMYRTYNNGRWLPWVSNANPTIMNNIKSKYNLPGTLDTASGDAGLPGSGVPVNAIEIRIFEGETSGSTGSSVGGQPVGNMKTIYIDAGHGGSDPGAVGNGLREKDITLKLSLYQAKHFKEAGYNVILSRSTDTYVSLSQRSSEANRLNADLFISNHVNAGGGTGCEVYCSRVGGTSRECANAVSQALSQAFYNRGVKVKIGDDGRDYYHVIRETKMPAILIEHGFIDNAKDAGMLSGDANLEKYAMDTVAAIKRIAPPEKIDTADILKRGGNSYLFKNSQINFREFDVEVPLGKICWNPEITLSAKLSISPSNSVSTGSITIGDMESYKKLSASAIQGLCELEVNFDFTKNQLVDTLAALSYSLPVGDHLTFKVSYMFSMYVTIEVKYNAKEIHPDLYQSYIFRIKKDRKDDLPVPSIINLKLLSGNERDNDSCKEEDALTFIIAFAISLGIVKFGFAAAASGSIEGALYGGYEFIRHKLMSSPIFG